MALNPDSRGLALPAQLSWCRDLAEWPQSWMGDERDLVPGQRIVEYFTPFLLHLAGSGLTKKTIGKHVDNLWVLGGEIIRDLQETPKLRKKPVNELIDTLLENDGPLIYHCDSEEQQRSFESTCRKLRRYLNASATGA
ncbi:MAG: hypothetical protein H7Y20_08435 [Bryobacteraceae bacterium]|nr:hypothetical protein [Bryobacteraceae bacterium]